MERNQFKESSQFSLDEGRVITQENGIQLIAYEIDKMKSVYRYIEVDSRKELLRTIENTKSGLNSINKIDRDYWDTIIDGVNIGETDFEMNTPYKLTVMIGEATVNITTIE